VVRPKTVRHKKPQYTYTYTHAQAHTHAHTRIHTRTHTYAHTHTWETYAPLGHRCQDGMAENKYNTKQYTLSHARTHMHIHKRTHPHPETHTHTYTHMHAHTHTHKHTRIQKNVRAHRASLPGWYGQKHLRYWVLHAAGKMCLEEGVCAPCCFLCASFRSQVAVVLNRQYRPLSTVILVVCCTLLQK